MTDHETHYACEEMLEKYEGKPPSITSTPPGLSLVVCCGCTNHKCLEPGSGPSNWTVLAEIGKEHTFTVPIDDLDAGSVMVMSHINKDGTKTNLRKFRLGKDGEWTPYQTDFKKAS